MPLDLLQREAEPGLGDEPVQRGPGVLVVVLVVAVIVVDPRRPQDSTIAESTSGPIPMSRRSRSGGDPSQAYASPVSGWMDGGRTACLPVPRKSISQSRFLTSRPLRGSKTISNPSETASFRPANGLSQIR